jgi:hypothetical protein
VTDSPKAPEEHLQTGPPPTAFDAALSVAALYERIGKIEQPAPKKEHWYESSLFSSVLSGVILAIFAYVLTGRLEQSAKERELTIQSATEMQQLMVKISTGTQEEAEAAALSMTMFGTYAIPPLIESLQKGTVAPVAAEKGLRALVLTNGKDLCGDLATVLNNRNQLYTAASHAAVIRVLGAGNCTDALPALRQYADLIKKAGADPGLKEYEQSVLNATPSNVADARTELQKTFQLLHDDYKF